MRKRSVKSTALTIECYAAIRIGELIDISTLSATKGIAWALADRRDEQNRMRIRRGETLPFLRIAHVRIEEIR